MIKRVFSVSQINAYIHRIFDGDYALRKIDIKGEVSNCKYHSSGHIYFSLKDARSSLRCIMFSSDRPRGLKFRLENGQQVTVSGNITVYERDGSYQLYAREIVLAGVGELYIRYEQLKKELAEAGYFDFDRKKELPPYPERIGIVTALTGAAIQDIKSVARRRNPYVQLILYPAKVQGEGAARTIADGIRYFDREDVDIIIIGRGGGSIEDLWAFNERELADAIYKAETPIISGTGHEIDMTIADYCADVRAATPSAACELAIPDIFSILQQMEQYAESLDHRIRQRLSRYKERYEQLNRLLEARHPGALLMKQQMQLNAYQTALHRRMEEILTDRQMELAEYRTGLQRRMEKLVMLQQMELQAYNNGLHLAMDRKLTEQKHRLEILGQRLTLASPSARLKGGYVFAQDLSGRPIVSVKMLEADRPFSLIFSDGEAKVALYEE